MTNALIIDHESFQPAKADAAEVGEHFAKLINGRVKLTCGNKTFDAWAIKYESGNIAALGFVGQYRTGAKHWRASVTHVAAGTGAYTIVRFGRYDRSGRFQKQGAVSFAPEIYFS